MPTHGSLQNLLMARGKVSQPAVPRVGDGATIVLWTDRIACTVIEVKTPRKIVIQEDNAIRTDKNGMSKTQEYRYRRAP